MIASSPATGVVEKAQPAPISEDERVEPIASRPEEIRWRQYDIVPISKDEDVMSNSQMIASPPATGVVEKARRIPI